MAFLRANMKSSLVIVLALGCGILAVFWPQWRGELRAQGYYPGFGAGGKVTTAFEDLAQARAVAIQADGKIVAAGYAVLSGNQNFALVRYNTDGTLDTSFGAGGKVTTDFFGFGRVNALAIQADGRIVAAGFGFGPGGLDFALGRYNTDGTLDAGFGDGGKVTTDFGGGSQVASAVAIQADGKIVVAGDAFVSLRLFAVARYNTDGTLDPGFGDGGKVTTDFGGGVAAASAVAIQADGKIVAAGVAFLSGFGFSNFALVRYNTDGTPDAGFGAGGKVTTDFAGGAFAVAIQADGQIVAAGFGGGIFNLGFALARYNTDGTLDTSFGAGGKVFTRFGGVQQAFGMAIQVDGKIVAAGGATVSTPDFALARYNTDGTPDTSFGAGGIATTDFLSGTDTAFAVAIQPDAKIVAAGYASAGSGEVFALARYDSGLTPLDLTTALSARVEALVDAGILNPGQGNSLSSKLAHVVQSLNLGKIDTACNQLRAFINEVDAFIGSGVLTSAQGEPLISAATGIRNTLGCR